MENSKSNGNVVRGIPKQTQILNRFRVGAWDDMVQDDVVGDDKT